ncbi:hypothetical protein GGI12_005904, partial [Dipsacomyces acuminosporus]
MANIPAHEAPRRYRASYDPEPRTPDRPFYSTPVRRLSSGLRRAKAATGNSIKKLFRGHHTTNSKQDTDEGLRTTNPGLSLDSENTHDCSCAMPFEENHSSCRGMSSTMAPIEASSTLVCNQHAVRRPSTSQSTRSVRGIYSAAKKLTRRTSSIFRRQTKEEVPEDDCFAADALRLNSSPTARSRRKTLPWHMTYSNNTSLPQQQHTQAVSVDNESIPSKYGQYTRRA